MIAIQITTVISIGVAALFMAHYARLLESDISRLLVVASIAALVATMPLFNSMLMIDRLIAMTIGGAGLHYMLRMAFGPVRYDVLQLVPVILMQARRGGYRMQYQTVRI